MQTGSRAGMMTEGEMDDTTMEVEAMEEIIMELAATMEGMEDTTLAPPKAEGAGGMGEEGGREEIEDEEGDVGSSDVGGEVARGGAETST